MDRNFQKTFRSHAENEELNEAVRGESILVQTKRIPKNYIRKQGNSRQSRIREEYSQDQQRSGPSPTVAHQIRIIKQKPCKGEVKDPESVVDKLFDTNAYKRTKDEQFPPRKQNFNKKSEKAVHPRKDVKVADTSGFIHRPIQSYNPSSSVVEDEVDINNNYVSRLKKRRMKSKRPLHNEKMEIRSQTETEKIETPRRLYDLDYYIKLSQKKFLHEQKLKHYLRVKNISQHPKENPKRTKKITPLLPVKKDTKVKQLPSFRKENFGSVSPRKNLNPVSVKCDPIGMKSKDISTWKTNAFPSNKQQGIKRNVPKVKKIKKKTKKNKIDSAIFNDSRQESFRKVPPSSPIKAASKLKTFSKKSSKKHFVENKFIKKTPNPSVFGKLKNWMNAKRLEAKVKRVIIFREKNKWSILSDSETESVQYDDLPQYGDEWLAYTGSDTSFDQDAYEQGYKQRIDSNFSEESHKLYMSLQPYFKTLKLFGRLPIVIEKENQEIKCKVNRKSCNYLWFCITTILLTIITGKLAVEFVEMKSLSSQSSHNVNQKSDMGIVDKYWIAGLITFLNLLYILLWSYSMIFRNGLHLEDYLSRWHSALAMIKYSPDASASKFIGWHQLFLALYCIMSTIVFFFGKQYWPLFWGNGELIAMLLFKRLIQNPRSHQYFFWMRICGHFIYLYSVFCSRMITLFVLVHCKLVETISRRWNLRLGCVLQKVAIIQSGTDTFTIKRKIIPYTKLFVEHLVVTSLSLHTGKVFALVGLTYYAFKGIIMFSSVYVLATHYLLSVYNQSNPIIVGKQKETTDFVWKGRDLKILTDIFIMAQCWIGFLITSDTISKVGSVIMNGYDFVRRHGLILCMSSTERRFILSMEFAFAPMHNYCINFGFRVDRVFIYKFMSAVFGFCILVVVFSPIRWKIENIRQCKNGTCVDLHFPRLFRKDVLKRIQQ